MPRIKNKTATTSNLAFYDTSSEKREFSDLVDFYLQKYKLFDWTFKFNRLSTIAGQCNSDKKEFYFSQYLVNNQNISMELKKNTILHEIAHALVGCSNGHNSVWQEKAYEIGCDGREFHNMKLRKRLKYRCPCKRLILRFFRKTSKLRVCNECQCFATLVVKDICA